MTRTNMPEQMLANCTKKKGACWVAAYYRRTKEGLFFYHDDAKMYRLFGLLFCAGFCHDYERILLTRCLICGLANEELTSTYLRVEYKLWRIFRRGFFLTERKYTIHVPVDKLPIFKRIPNQMRRLFT